MAAMDHPDGESRVQDRGMAGTVSPEVLAETPPPPQASITGGVAAALAHDSAAKHVSGAARYIDDDPELPGTLQVYIAMSTRAHARITGLDLAAVRTAKGVVAVLSAADIPGINDYSPVFGDDPIFAEDTAEYVGQSIFAVAAESLGAARAAASLAVIGYEDRPAAISIDAAEELADAAGADLLPPHEMRLGDVEAALAASDATYSETFNTQRVQHMALETHGATAWFDEAGVLNLRSSTQVPFLVKRTLERVFSLPAGSVRVVAGRVGGGFGGKQEVLVEDVLALAALRFRRPVRLEFTRSEVFTATTTRHPFRVKVSVGGTRGGKLTALAIAVLTDTGAYGNHAPGVMFHGCSESMAVYNTANKRVDAQAVYTNTVPSGGFRGYGLSQIIFAIESALDELARKLGLDPLEFRANSMLREHDAMLSLHAEPEADLIIGSYGLDQCMELTRNALKRGAARGADGHELDGDWLIGEGTALSMIATVPPRGHHAHSIIESAGDGTFVLKVGTAEFGNGTSTVHTQLAADALGTGADAMVLMQSDTALTEHDTGAYGSSGTVVAGKATYAAARALALQLRTVAAELGDARLEDCVLHPGGVYCAGQFFTHRQLLEAATPTGRHRAEGRWGGTPRSVAFNVHGFRVAVDPRTGEIRILQSVQAADAGVVVNPRQCRGQIEGGIAQALGATLFEEMLIDGTGKVVTDVLRQYHVPTFADVPRSEIYFAKTTDSLGPLGAKSMSESPVNPVAPALANALRDATGIRFTRTPFRRDDIYLALEAAGKVPPLVPTQQMEI